MIVKHLNLTIKYNLFTFLWLISKHTLLVQDNCLPPLTTCDLSTPNNHQEQQQTISSHLRKAINGAIRPGLIN